MKKYEQDLLTSQEQLTLGVFLESFNKNMPESFPKATAPLLKKFKDSHESLFKDSNSWSLDVHRKKLIDWVPGNI